MAKTLMLYPASTKTTNQKANKPLQTSARQTVLRRTTTN